MTGRRIIISCADHENVDAFVDELLGAIQTCIDDTDLAGIPVTVSLECGECMVCHEPINYDAGRSHYYHAHSGDIYCGTGDGSVAYPPTDRYLSGDASEDDE